MATSFDILAFDPAVFEIDQGVTFGPFIIDVSSRAFRASQIASPFLDLADDYLVIGQRIDLANRRVTYICEQVIFATGIILSSETFGSGFEIPTVQEPTTLVIDERWEPVVQEPTTLVFDERWELEFTQPVPPEDNPIETVVIDERWEA